MSVQFVKGLESGAHLSARLVRNSTIRRGRQGRSGPVTFLDTLDNTLGILKYTGTLLTDCTNLNMKPKFDGHVYSIRETPNC